jgi:putative flippase GtrA
MAMPPQATPSAEVAARDDAGWRTLGRHQLGAMGATAVDFATMIACVEILHLVPTLATAIGAALGGITNFALGRAWIFRRHSGRVGWQAARYALVSGGGAGWNALGEFVVQGQAHVQYVVARGIVSIAVSLLWNYPMQREFVFREGKSK